MIRISTSRHVRRMFSFCRLLGLVPMLFVASALATVGDAPREQANEISASRVLAQADLDAQRAALKLRRDWIDYEFRQAEIACYKKFFVTSCLDGARETQRVQLQDIHRVEIALNDIERAQRAHQRDAKAEQQRFEAEAGRAQREADERASRTAYQRKQEIQTQREAERLAREGLQVPQRVTGQGGRDSKTLRMQAEAQAKAEQDARQRQENVMRFEDKQRQAAERQKALDERRADFARRQAERDAKRRAEQERLRQIESERP